jgi:hypothetical protein
LRQRLAGASHSEHEQHHTSPLTPINSHSLPTPQRSSFPLTSVANPPIEEIRSASTELLTSETLKELKQVLQIAYQEHEHITDQLDTARSDKQRALERYCSWNNGLLFKRMFKKKFAVRNAQLQTAEAKVEELEQQLRLTTISAKLEIAKEQAEPYFRMRDEFAALSQCSAIWDVKSHRATNKVRERTTADMRLDRQAVTFSLSNCHLIQWEQKVPHLQNANGGDLFLYPGFILYRATKEAFSVIDFHDVKQIGAVIRFHEEQGVPGDSEVIGQTWAKCNKDGSRDKRFANNYQIPIVLYGSLELKSETGLWEQFQFSNPERLQKFLVAWNAFVASFGERPH